MRLIPDWQEYRGVAIMLFFFALCFVVFSIAPTISALERLWQRARGRCRLGYFVFPLWARC